MRGRSAASHWKRASARNLHASGHATTSSTTTRDALGMINCGESKKHSAYVSLVGVRLAITVTELAALFAISIRLLAHTTRSASTTTCPSARKRYTQQSFRGPYQGLATVTHTPGADTSHASQSQTSRARIRPLGHVLGRCMDAQLAAPSSQFLTQFCCAELGPSVGTGGAHGAEGLLKFIHSFSYY